MPSIRLEGSYEPKELEFIITLQKEADKMECSIKSIKKYSYNSTIEVVFYKEDIEKDEKHEK